MKIGNRTLSSWYSVIDTAIGEHNSIEMGVEWEPSGEMDNLTVAIETNSKKQVDVQIAIDLATTDANGNGVIYAAFLLVFLNALIISEVNQRHDGERLVRLSHRILFSIRLFIGRLPHYLLHFYRSQHWLR